MSISKRFIPFFAVVALVGCGKDGATQSPVPPKSLTEAQSALPDSGYWMCRIDYKYRDSYGYTKSSTYAAAAEGRAAAKQQISEACLNGYYAEECLPVIARQEFRCARAQNTGGLNDYLGYTVCQLPFTYRDSYGYTKSNSYRISGPTQGATMKLIFDACLRGYYNDECTNAVYNGAATCTTME